MPIHRTALIALTITLAASVLGQSGPCAQGAEGSPRKSDHVELAEPASAKAHATSMRDGALIETLTTEVGTLHSTWRVVTLSGLGATLTLDLHPSPSPAGHLLEIEEIHARRPQAFAYSVEVNGKPAYFRTYEEMGAGANRYFVRVPEGATTDGPLRITFRNQGHSPLSLRRVWAHADFFGLAEEEGVWKPMPILDEALSFLPVLKPKGEAVSRPDLDKVIGTDVEAKAWIDMKKALEGTPYTAGPFLNLVYANGSMAHIRANIDRGLERVLRHGLDFQIAFNSGEWGHHPSGPDGLGGYFSDARYSSITYDNASKRYRTSWPGTPGNTTWPNWNDPQLHRFLQHRLSQAVTHYRNRRDLMAAMGNILPHPQIDQDWGLATTADCSDFTRGMAKSDGVTWRPEDGLDEVEKMWLYRNMSKVPARFGAWFAKAIGTDAVVVDRGEIRLPERQSFDDYYFQTYAEAHHTPFRDDRWAGWQYGVGEQVWATGEYLPHLPRPYFDYIMALGKLTCPNVERAALPTLEYLQVCYERGFRGLFICNTRSGDIEMFAPQAKGLDERACSPAVSAAWKLLDLDYGQIASLGPQEVIAASNNLTVVGKLLQVADASKTGSITYRLTNEGRPIGGPLVLELTVQMDDNPANVIEISTGADAQSLRPRAIITTAEAPKTTTYPWKRHARVDLGDVLRHRTSAVIRITLRTAGSPAQAAIERLRAVRPWATASGHPGGEPFTIRQARILHLWTQDRAVFERLQRIYRQRASEDADWHQAADLADAGSLGSAYRSLSGALSQVLPARFAIRGHGYLGVLPLVVSLADDDATMLIDVTAAGPSGATFSVTSETDQPFTMTLTGANVGTWSATSSGNNTWNLHLDPAGSLKATAGIVCANLQASRFDHPRYRLPSKLVGNIKSRNAKEIVIETQDENLWLDNPITIPLAASPTLTRINDLDGSPLKDLQPKWTDRVELTINPDGIATAIHAILGVDSAKVVRYEPPSLQEKNHNGILEVEGGRRYEFSNMWGFTHIDVPRLHQMTRFNTPERMTRVLRPGLAVQVTYIPSTVPGQIPRIAQLKAPPIQKDPNISPSVISDDGFRNGWIPNGWGSTIDPNSTRVVHTGKTALAITFTAAGCGSGSFHTGGNFDVSPFGTLTFWINGGLHGGQKLALRFFESGEQYTLPAPLVANSWTKHTVKLADIRAAEVDDLLALRFMDLGGTSVGKTFYVDDWVFGP